VLDPAKQWSSEKSLQCECGAVIDLTYKPTMSFQCPICKEMINPMLKENKEASVSVNES
jgi:hypothetical protein